MAWFYDLSFSFFVVVTGAAVLASGVSLVLPALFSSSNSADPNVNWNVIAIVGSYVAIAMISLGIYLSRKITTMQKLRSIPQKVVASKEGESPAAVARLVAVEYDRSCVIAQVSLPQTNAAEGLGIPGIDAGCTVRPLDTDYDGPQFRRAILQSLQSLDAAVRRLVPTFPHMRPHQSVEAHLRPLQGILTHDGTRLNAYSDFIQAARYAEEEPSREDYETCMRIHTVFHNEMLHLLQSDAFLLVNITEQ